jgi:hypothetical protein
MRVFSFIFSAVLLSLHVVSLNATTIRVPGDQPTIQAGIDATVDGDTVLVANGIYTGDGNRDIDFLGRAIVVTSENGPENCVISCEGNEFEPHRGFFFHNGEDTGSVLQGFTISNGYTSKGGAILCSSSSPTILKNIITGNSAYNTYTGYGGGIYCNYSSPVILDNRVMMNEAHYGGGMYFDNNSQPNVSGNTVLLNTASYDGGGMVTISE